MTFLVLSFLTIGTVSGAEAPKDTEALAGLKTGKVIFDIRVTDMEKLTFNLELINDGLLPLAGRSGIAEEFNELRLSARRGDDARSGGIAAYLLRRCGSLLIAAPGQKPDCQDCKYGADHCQYVSLAFHAA